MEKMALKVIRGGKINFFEREEECPHAPGQEELWQESFVIMSWDTEKKVYVFFRMSQTPNEVNGSFTTVWLNVWTPEYMYKYTDGAIPLKANDRTVNSLTSGDGLCRYENDNNGNHNWRVREGEVAVDLTMEDYHKGMNIYPESAECLIKETIPHHTEAIGWVTGTVKVKDKQYSVAGHGWRDHSWGHRNWANFRVHRVYPAIFGKEFYFLGLTFVGSDGIFTKSGVVIRNNTVQFTQDFQIVAYIGEDGVSNCGGRVTLNLDGKKHIIDYEPIGKSVISILHGFPCVDCLCKVKMGDKVGVGWSETSHNAQGGTERPHVFPSSPGVIDNGLFSV